MDLNAFHDARTMARSALEGTVEANPWAVECRIDAGRALAAVIGDGTAPDVNEVISLRGILLRERLFPTNYHLVRNAKLLILFGCHCDERTYLNRLRTESSAQRFPRDILACRDVSPFKSVPR